MKNFNLKYLVLFSAAALVFLFSVKLVNAYSYIQGRLSCSKPYNKICNDNCSAGDGLTETRFFYIKDFWIGSTGEWDDHIDYGIVRNFSSAWTGSAGPTTVSSRGTRRRRPPAAPAVGRLG